MMKKKIGRYVVASIAMAVSICSFTQVSAQEVKLNISAENFSEGYTGQVNVSSAGVLVGLSIGAKSVWTISNVAVELPKDTPKQLCLRISSLDGRFWSENPYLPPSGVTTASLGPLTKQYTKVLKTMSSEQLAFRIAVPTSTGCTDLSSAHYLPVIGSGESVLVVHINSGDRRVVTRLSRAGKAISNNVECEPIVNSARVAADRVCRIPLPEASGRADLQLALIGMTGQAEKLKFDIYIPPYTLKH
ncbi:MAG: hypothetical protein COA69_03050 [Robiginitomaculum sp.]|nr:MAG: hypothetical protein COA69_03050 [Robiginitomaculum sp.]